MTPSSRVSSSLTVPRRRKCRASTLQYLIIFSTMILMVFFWVVMFRFHIHVERDQQNLLVSPQRPQRQEKFQPQTRRGQQQTQKQKEPRKAKATIAYAVSLTSCGHVSTASHGSGGHSSDPNLHEGAAVLAHSIHLSSVRHASSGSHYDYKLMVFVHHDAVECSHVFSDLGYEVLVRPTPFNVTDIRGQFLREHIVKSGCCGEKEYLKLYAYTLMEYPVVVHLDLDSLILKPLDDLFDAMLEGPTVSSAGRIPVMFNHPLPQNNPIDAFFTRDYNMVNPGHKHVGIQGGFLVIRPSMEAFHNYVEVVLEGNFVQGNGWGSKGYGGYFGAQQIQGICSYYYDYLHPGTAVELNRCYYNAMADEPRQREHAGQKAGMCRDGRETCQDCREVDVREVKSVHFTLCNKPWKCPTWEGMDEKGVTICKEFHKEWFRVREDLEETLSGGNIQNPGGKHNPEIFRGYCKSAHERGYIPLGKNR
ncbi:hypothetical protein ACHAW6_005553 [Cyclotella cf. meneghiniana]